MYTGRDGDVVLTKAARELDGDLKVYEKNERYQPRWSADTPRFKQAFALCLQSDMRTREGKINAKLTQLADLAKNKSLSSGQEVQKVRRRRQRMWGAITKLYAEWYVRLVVLCDKHVHRKLSQGDRFA